MEKYQLYEDIQTRTNGDIYVGVVGPVRVGKSTFISQFMQKLVIPNIENKNVRDRAIDELPQSADGKTVMTTQPKFVPNEAVKISVAENVNLKVRMIDCVGYLVSGAMGATENDKPRLVKTPWSEEEMPFEEAAELGTKKVIEEHSTIGIVLTTDGSVTDIERANYIQAEERVVAEMKACGKPFVMVLNCKNPNSNDNKKLAQSLSEKYQAQVVAMNVAEMKESDVDKIFEKVLLEFPIKSVKVNMPKWLQALSYSNPIITEIIREIKGFGSKVRKIGDASKETIVFTESECFDPITFSNIEMGEGVIRFNVVPKENLFYKVLSDECGFVINDDFELVSYIKNLAVAKIEYDKLKGALDEVEQTGYGIVIPNKDEYTLESPEVIKQGSKYGVKIKASAPSLHIIKVDVETEVTPLVGNEMQSQDLVNYLTEKFESDPQGIWETNLLGKSLYSLVDDNISAKIVMMPVDAQRKMKKTLKRIINEGKGGVLCILL
ncbi:MAG: stage IV sporulation protein A [Clostridiales bacterium]|nr:stage IV sporulation protein A [Clostridiales bacterium]